MSFFNKLIKRYSTVEKYYLGVAEDYYKYHRGDQNEKDFLFFLAERRGAYTLEDFAELLNDKDFDLISELKLFKKLGGIIDNSEINIFSNSEYDNNTEENSECVPGTVRTLKEIQRQIDLNEKNFFLSIRSEVIGYGMHKEIIGFLKDLIKEKRDAKTCELYIKENIIDYYVNAWELCNTKCCTLSGNPVLEAIAMVFTLIYLLKKNANLKAMVDFLNADLNSPELKKLVLFFLQEKIEEMNVNNIPLNKDDNLWWFWNGNEGEKIAKDRALLRFKGKKCLNSTESIYDCMKKDVNSIY